MTRKDKKSRNHRGSRTHGRGSRKKGRHSGHKGGKGQAGSHKHHWIKTIREDPLHFGKHGFNRPQQLQKKVETTNVGELDENAEKLVEEGLAEKKEDEITIDVSKLNIDKVLGGGKVTQPLKVRAEGFSKSAEQKLKESGGTAEKGEE